MQITENFWSSVRLVTLINEVVTFFLPSYSWSILERLLVVPISWISLLNPIRRKSKVNRLHLTTVWIKEISVFVFYTFSKISKYVFTPYGFLWVNTLYIVYILTLCVLPNRVPGVHERCWIKHSAGGFTLHHPRPFLKTCLHLLSAYISNTRVLSRLDFNYSQITPLKPWKVC